ncbi:MSMEG_0565 family glycosyltransferase [filamentous cyanobacterium LEGE 11480]|uniref:MSMEG_0565 family glycosyltransferase n=1 Tax=Romeriopsis navalis LEGE 11480 TaxID=2777977 RepID=A0A928Z112_9CYAN|nr:MSMEG_0565 family glycosyltransferase [Romeriopsis navalis]MBE9028831.1 MSMEG_0565 family glycosyltransferase [Romeriopsis navalis LEGE 11480]
MLRIALLTYSTKPRGSVVHTWELATALADLGHTVCVYALDKDGLGFERSANFEVQLVAAKPAPTSLDDLIKQRIQEFVDALSQELAQYDIYHSQDCIGANALVKLRQQKKLQHVVRTVHHIEDYQSIYLRECQDKSIRLPDLCLCVSDRWQVALQKEYQIIAPRVINGVNVNRFSPERSGQETRLKRIYGINGNPVYLTVGGIEPRKNSLNLLRAFAQVRAQQPVAQLVIVGGATLFDYQDYRDRFFQLAKQLGIEVGQSLILPGVVSDADLPAMYRCGDVFCFPSLKEGWGLVVMEAIAAGLPIVLSDQSPFTEFMGVDQACWVDPQLPSSIARGMLKLTHDQLRINLVAKSRAILPNYSWPHSAQLHVAHYRQLIAAAG